MRINFNYQATKAFNGSNPIVPPGDYVVKIVGEDEGVPLKNGNGTALVFDYQIVEGAKAGNHLSDWLNVGHASEKARGAAQGQLKAIGEALGFANLNDTRELFNRPFVVSVSVDVYNGTERNRINSYKAVNAPQPAPQNYAQPAPAPTQPTATAPTTPAQPYGASPWA